MAPAVDCSAVCTLMAVSVRLHILHSGGLRGRATQQKHTIQFNSSLPCVLHTPLPDKPVLAGRGGRQVPMAGLQRSATTFRRSGSSGLVWDERFLAEAEAKAAADGATEEPQPELRHSRSVGSIGMLRRGGAGGDGDDKKAKEKKKQKQGHKDDAHNGGQQVFRTKDVAPDVDPPSPRVSGCILCSIFRGGSSGSGASSARRRSKPRRK